MVAIVTCSPADHPDFTGQIRRGLVLSRWGTAGAGAPAFYLIETTERIDKDPPRSSHWHLHMSPCFRIGRARASDEAAARVFAAQAS